MDGGFQCQAGRETSRHNARVRSDPATVLALTMGDPCGIGPEIVAKLFREPDAAGCVVVGDAANSVTAMKRTTCPRSKVVVPACQFCTGSSFKGLPAFTRGRGWRRSTAACRRCA